MAEIIATELQAASLGGGATSNPNMCVTYARAIALGAVVSGSYASNQLVCLSSLSSRYTCSARWTALLYDSYYNGGLYILQAPGYNSFYVVFYLTVYDNVSKTYIYNDYTVKSPTLNGSYNLPSGVTLKLTVHQGPYRVVNDCYILATVPPEQRPYISQYGAGYVSMACYYKGQYAGTGTSWIVNK